ncbi:MAG TPA: Na+/H+ antiporter [Chroococcales cyanobacterium]
MTDADTPLQINTLLTLLLIASATAICTKWIKIPYAVALVTAGLCIGLFKVLPPVQMTPDLVLVIFLPALLFECAWSLDLDILRKNWRAICALATVGVVVCMFGVAVILHCLGSMNYTTAMLFGAMIAATDPVSVIALCRRLGVDHRLTMILEGESLFNDGTAVVLFKIVLAVVLAGTAFSPVKCAFDFVFTVLGGAVFGAGVGFATSKITSAFDDHLLETMITAVVAYGTYLAADQLHLSTVIAVVAAGIVVGNYGAKQGMSATTRFAVDSFWEFAAFLCNSLLFLLIGLQVQIPLLMKHKSQIGLGILAVVIARIIVVYGICPCVSTRTLPIPIKWQHFLFWGGLRGALVMALALSLPLSFPDREGIINMTFGVVLFTLLIPGLTIEPLARVLGIRAEGTSNSAERPLRAHLEPHDVESEKLTLDRLREEGKISDDDYDSFRKASS